MELVLTVYGADEGEAGDNPEEGHCDDAEVTDPGLFYPLSPSALGQSEQASVCPGPLRYGQLVISSELSLMCHKNFTVAHIMLTCFQLSAFGIVFVTNCYCSQSDSVTQVRFNVCIFSLVSSLLINTKLS